MRELLTLAPNLLEILRRLVTASQWGKTQRRLSLNIDEESAIRRGERAESKDKAICVLVEQLIQAHSNGGTEYLGEGTVIFGIKGG